MTNSKTESLSQSLSKIMILGVNRTLFLSKIINSEYTNKKEDEKSSFSSFFFGSSLKLLITLKNLERQFKVTLIFEVTTFTFLFENSLMLLKLKSIHH